VCSKRGRGVVKPVYKSELLSLDVFDTKKESA